jgi:SAM-dependent methyltransferase
MKLKESIRTIKKNGINYILDDKGRLRKFKPWLGDIFSFLYDRIMEKSVFPKKFKGSITKHLDILKEQYRNIHGRNLLEIASGSGQAAYLLNNDNSYTGIDISRGLLLQAVNKFKANNFQDADFYIADASDLPFSEGYFDIAICDLSLNFLGDIETFIKELKRVMKKGSIFYCSVPIPERKDPKVTIHGSLYPENKLKNLFEKYGFSFMPKSSENGALLYFEAELLAKQ